MGEACLWGGGLGEGASGTPLQSTCTAASDLSHCSLWKLPLLFFRVSKSNVQAPSNPSQRLWPTPASQRCLRQAGAWGRERLERAARAPMGFQKRR